jgi:hypothetical protein
MEKKKDPIVYNDLCLKCRKECKQLISTKLLTCPHFDRKEEQLEIKFPGFRKRKV